MPIGRNAVNLDLRVFRSTDTQLEDVTDRGRELQIFGSVTSGALLPISFVVLETNVAQGISKSHSVRMFGVIFKDSNILQCFFRSGDHISKHIKT